ncbi:hypothetical protein CDD82_5415 [Ophiocordyceps australis]|uniref:Mitochondrial division protein 1 n=1 Tax=Ophiocordyceps australis TaxID=1399860 RepID=A0A2C5ZRD6_9HYPO|nr:hypothetical protein CDD82_5415 [Ophiocordyceps australis]
MDDTLDTSMDRSYAKTGGELPHYMIASNGRQIVLYQYVEDGGTTQILDISKGAITSIIDDALSPWSCRPRFSANGQMLAVARENSITIRDVSTGTILSTLGHKLVDIECVACSPNGSLAAFSGFDPNQLVSSVKLCNIAAGTRRDWEHSSATAVSPNVDLVAYATKDNKIELRDTSGTTVLRTLEGHNSTIRILVFSLDGKLITSASDQETGGSIMIWDRVTGTALHSLQGHSKRIHTLVFAPHGQTLASASQDQTVRLWGVTNGLALQVLHHTRPINIIAFSSDGTVLASSDSGSEVTLWDVASGAILRKLQGSRIVFDFWPNSSLIASVSASDGTISIWNTATDDKPRIIQADSDSFSVVIFSPDGKLMASASGHDSVIKLWDTATGVTLHNFKSNSSIIMRTDIKFSPSGKLLAVVTDFPGRHYAIRLWDVATGAVVRDLQSESGVLFIHTMAFSPDEKVIAAGFNTLGLLAWDTETGTLLEGIHPPGWEKYDIHSTGAKICISFSPDGVNLAVTLSRPTKQICLWDTSTGMSLAQFRTRPSDSDKRVDNLAISPDTMSKLVASSSENVITVWDGVRGDALTLEGHSGDIASISFSPDGGVLASSSLDATIRLWDVKSAKMLHILEAHDSGVENVVFSHNGKLLASASIDEVVKLWNPETGMCLGSIHAQCSLKQLAFSQRGPYLETERGVLDFGHIVGSVSETESKRPSNLYIRGNWITWDMKNLIWLPPGYRQVHPSCEGNVVTFLDIKGGEPITFLELGPRGTNVAANCQEVDQDDC